MDLFLEMVRTQGLTGGLLCFFIFLHEGALKRIEKKIEILFFCKDCKFKKVVDENDNTKQ